MGDGVGSQVVSAGQPDRGAAERGGRPGQRRRAPEQDDDADEQHEHAEPGDHGLGRSGAAPLQWPVDEDVEQCAEGGGDEEQAAGDGGPDRPVPHHDEVAQQVGDGHGLGTLGDVEHPGGAVADDQADAAECGGAADGESGEGEVDGEAERVGGGCGEEGVHGCSAARRGRFTRTGGGVGVGVKARVGGGWGAERAGRQPPGPDGVRVDRYGPCLAGDQWAVRPVVAGASGDGQPSPGARAGRIGSEAAGFGVGSEARFRFRFDQQVVQPLHPSVGQVLVLRQGRRPQGDQDGSGHDQRCARDGGGGQVGDLLLDEALSGDPVPAEYAQHGPGRDEEPARPLPGTPERAGPGAPTPERTAPEDSAPERTAPEGGTLRGVTGDFSVRLRFVHGSAFMVSPETFPGSAWNSIRDTERPARAAQARGITMHVTRSGTPTGGSRALRMATALLVLTLAGSVAACSSSKSGSSASSPATASASASAGTSGSASASATGTAPADPAAAKAEITTNWEKFFDPNTPIPDKAKLLQGGDALLPVLQGFSQDPRVGQVQAKVGDVAFTDASDATVTYSLSLQGTVVEPSASGQAVLENGTWKVSRSTLCGLLTQAGGASGTPIPGCS